MTGRSAERTEFLKDVLITAVESDGYVTWFSYSQYRPDEGSARVWEDEEETGDWQDRGAVTIEELASAIRKMLADPAGTHSRGVTDEIRQANAENDAGYLDVWSADAIMQVAVLGDVIYG